MKTDVILGENGEAPDHNTNEDDWERIVCTCGKHHWEVFWTADYETSVRCIYCGYMDTVHTG
jgi:hypothetical protein